MKKCTVWFMALLLSFSLFSLDVEAAGLEDLQSSDRFYEEISYLIDKGVISGYADGTFKPGNAVTRGDAAIMIGRLLDLDGTQRETKFKDVRKESAASGYIASAVEKGIILGYANGTFKPGVEMSRGDMAIILSRALNFEYESVFGFKDVGKNMAAYYYIGRLAGASITVGYPDGTFRPSENITRAQFAAFLARGLKIEFQQKAAIENGYARDKTKQYIYNDLYGERVIETYKKIGSLLRGDLEYVWETYSTKFDSKVHHAVDESYEGLAIRYSDSDISFHITHLRYPLEIGRTWESQGTTETITGINKTVETPFQTFTDAVETTGFFGEKRYFVKGIGLVKFTHPDGIIELELADIKSNE